uniref:galactokinase family protein n=1 Tax=Tessaracoccus timonensis TaxID=2161816 RepID=UPI000D55CB93|nr:galactokinase family protein [Tessaracoccus timonensis]
MSAGWWVPGRIEVLGKHTDYGGGRVLVCAVERGVTAEAVPGGDGVRARTSVFPNDVVELHAGVSPALPPGHWGHYVQTVIDRLTSNFGPVAPASITITADLPPASGMSSSSALLSSVALTLADMSGFTTSELWRTHCDDRMALAGYLAAIENGGRYGDLAGAAGVGTSGGSLDHTGMLASTAGKVSYVQFAPTSKLGQVSLPDGWVFVVGVSGVLAEKTGAARELYNRGPATLRSWLANWNERTGAEASSVQQVLERVGPDEILARTAVGYERRRLTQFVRESGEFVPRAFDALERGDVDEFGALCAESQALAVIGLENEIPETKALVETALRGGAAAASSFGAGFGGSVWALVRAADAEAFADDWLERYHAAIGACQGSTLITGAGAPGHRIG